MPISLDNEGLKEYVKEAVLQALRANKELLCEHNIQVTPKFKMTFSASVIAKGGLNAIERTTKGSNAEKYSESVDEGYTEVSERNGLQVSKNEEATKTTNHEEQTGSNNETGEQHSSNSQHEAVKSEGSATDEQTTKTDSNSKEDTNSKDQQKATQSQANGTTQVTTTEYSR